MLVRRSALERIGGIAAIRGALIDDVALGRAIKAGGPIRLALTRGAHSLRPYDRLGEVWAMVARTAFDQLGYSAFALAGTVLAMILVYVIPVAAVLAWLWHHDGTAALAGALAWSLMTLAAAPTLRLYGLSPVRGLALPAAAALYVAMTVDSARRHWSGRGGTWKARTHNPENPP